jgi:hypothetical protein
LSLSNGSFRRIEQLGQIRVPALGIGFVNSHIAIQTGIVTPVALLLNRALVRKDDDIECHTDRSELVVYPSSIRADDPEEDLNRAQVKILRLKSIVPNISGKLTASWKGVNAEISVTTTERDVITPINGIEFERDEYSIRLGSIRHLRLFIDTEKISIGDEIIVTADGPAVKILGGQHKLQESGRVTSSVAQIEIPAKGETLAADVIVTSSVGRYIAGTKVSVSKKERREHPGGGIFQGYDFVPMDRKVQALFDPQGWILINTKDPVNQRYFGQDPFRRFLGNRSTPYQIG